MVTEEEKIKEENRKIRFLRYLIDFTILSIQQDDLSYEDSKKLIEDAKRVALSLFPGKGEVCELIYRPRFQRILQERFGYIS